jgi:hypothetical protein
MGDWNGTIPSFAALGKVRARDLQTLADALTGVSGPATDFSSSFTITASTTAPTKGAGTVYTARYNRVGRWVDYFFEVTIGAGWSSGSGTYRFLLPITALTSPGIDVGTMRVFDAGTAYYVAALTIQDSTHVEAVLNGGTNVLGSAGPGTAWASTDVMRGQIRYEAAS